VPRGEILPREKSANSSGQEISSAHKATQRRARVRDSSGQDSVRTIIRTLAWHVDFAAIAKEIGKSTSGLQVDFFVHESSRHVKRLRASPAKDRQTRAALAQNRFTRIDPNPFATPQGGARSSEQGVIEP
jgi:aminoglycoside phosphotransferase family enzyme